MIIYSTFEKKMLLITFRKCAKFCRKKDYFLSLDTWKTAYQSVSTN